MNMKKYMESEYLSAKLVREAEEGKKFCFIISDVKEEDGKYGVKPMVEVDFNGIHKKWNPSKLSCSNIGKVYGEESRDWLGKRVELKVEEQNNGKDGVVGFILPVDQTKLVSQ